MDKRMVSGQCRKCFENNLYKVFRPLINHKQLLHDFLIKYDESKKTIE